MVASLSATIQHYFTSMARATCGVERVRHNIRELMSLISTNVGRAMLSAILSDHNCVTTDASWQWNEYGALFPLEQTIQRAAL